MKNLIIITATLLISGFCNAQSNWEKVEINSDVAISFPSKPNNNEANGQKTFILKHADSTANFIVAASDLGVLIGVDEATLAAEMEKEESWEQAKTAFVGSVGGDVTLIKDEMTVVKGIKAMKLKIDKKFPDGITNNITAIILVKGTISYNIIFVNRGGKSDESKRDKFFDSIEFKASK